MAECIKRVKQLKNRHHDWKINPIQENNPGMVDLAAEWFVVLDNQLAIADRMKTKNP